MNKLPCYIVRDLLPLYADDLLSPESTEEVKAHLNECDECRTLYEQMTGKIAGSEQEILEDTAEFDYLQKIRHKRRTLLITAVVIIALIAAAAFIHSRIQAAKAEISYDESSKTMVIYGKDDTDIKLPKTVNDASTLDAQFDSFHMKVQLSVLKTSGENLDSYLPAYLGRTNESIQFIKNYLRENCPEIDLADRADQYVEFSVFPNEDYSWSESEDRIEVKMGDFYWHREELYILSLLGNKNVQWKELGYAWYLGACIDPYSELMLTTSMDSMEKAPYYDAYIRGGGTAELSPENYKILSDAVSWYCLTKGKGIKWGTAYESWPLSMTAVYSGPAKLRDPGNEMSVSMASSFIAYLSNQYGFDTVSKFCFGDQTFEDAFATDWQSAYDSWSAWILDTYGDQ